jgi:hypothetical protein
VTQFSVQDCVSKTAKEKESMTSRAQRQSDMIGFPGPAMLRPELAAYFALRPKMRCKEARISPPTGVLAQLFDWNSHE